MSTRRTVGQKLCAAVILWVALWPAIHIGLTQLADLNPWFLGGWGMYTNTKRTAFVDLYVGESRDAVEFVPSSALSPRLLAAQTGFEGNVRVFGRNAPRRAFAAALEHEFPDDAFVLAIARGLMLNTETGELEVEERWFEFSQPVND